MKHLTNQLADWLSQPWSRLQRRFRQARPGSVLILVVALLVLLALMGTAYISSTRQERYASATGSLQRVIRENTDSYAKQLLGQAGDMIATAGDAGSVYTSFA